MKRIYICFIAVFILITSCNNTFSYTGYNSKISTDYEYTTPVLISITRDVKFEAELELVSGVVQIEINTPEGVTVDILTLSTPGKNTINRQYSIDYGIGRWTAKITSLKGSGYIKTKFHNKRNFEGFDEELSGSDGAAVSLLNKYNLNN